MSLVQYIHSTIRKETNRLGQPVSNLYGAVAGQSPGILNTQDAVWVVATVSASGLPSLNQFYALYASATSKRYSTLKAVDGIVGITGNVTSTAALFRGLVELPGATVIPLGVVANGPSNAFAIYVDGTLQRQGNDSLNLTLALDTGRHLIEIVAVATEIFIAVPSSLRVFYDLDILIAPVWSGVTTGYLDPSKGITGNTLTWYNDSRVGGWIVYRRQLVYLSLISTLGSLDQYGRYGVELADDQTPSIRIGDDLVSGNETMGTVTSASYDSTTVVTTVILQLPSSITAISPFWAGRTAAVGRFVEQTRFARTATVGTISWVDSNVVLGTSYEYMLQAYGLFDATQLSPFSLVEELTAGDITPPGSIVFATGYPTVVGGTVNVSFTTPADTDYDGVQVQLYENPVTGVATATFNTTTLADTAKSFIANTYTGWYLFITSGTGAGQTALIASHTATVFTLDAGTPWTTTPDGTSNYAVFRMVSIVTDFGTPSSLDQLTFIAPQEGIYCFLTFDHGLNIQDRFSCAVWVYTIAGASVLPETGVVVSNVAQNGQINTNVLGISLHAIPKQDHLFLDTFTGSEGFRLTNTLLTSGTSAASGNSLTTLTKTAAGWTANAYAGKRLRLTASSGLLSDFQTTILSNTATVLTVQTPFPYTPDSVTFEVLDHFPNTVQASVLNTTRDRWNPSTTAGTMSLDSLYFAGTLNAEYTVFADTGVSTLVTPMRMEATIGRGNTHVSGSNFTYRGNSANTQRWEYGIIHSSDTVVIPRWRFNSGGKGTWTNLQGVAWSRYDSARLIVELDGDIHTFRVADAYGHNEVVLGRVLGTAGPNDSCIGWNVRGESGGDALDTVRCISLDDLVRLRYRLLPDHANLRVTHWQGQATGGSTTSLTHAGRTWNLNELTPWRILITGGPGVGSDRGILSNTTTQIVPDTPFSAAITSSSTYTVYDQSYLGAESLQFWTNRSPSNAQTLEFHGEKTGLPNEPIKRVLVDANQVPELTLSVAKTATVGSNSTVVATVLADDDVKTWSFYARKAAWPTSDSTIDGSPDYTYLKAQQLPATTPSTSLQLGDGDWYFMAVPFDSNTSQGSVSTATLIGLTSGGGVAGALSHLNVTRIYSPVGVKLSWQHTSPLESPDNTNYIDIYADGAGPTTVIQTDGRAWWDGSAVNTTSGVGHVNDVRYTFGTKNTDPYSSVTYTIELYSGTSPTGTLTATYTRTYNFYGTYDSFGGA